MCQTVDRDPNDTRMHIRAIKVMPLAFDNPRRAMYQMREISMHQRLSDHANVVSLHRVLRDQSYIYLVMDYIPGGDLYHFTRKNRSMYAGNVDALKKMFLKIVDGVHVGAGTMVSRSILKPGEYAGFFPIDESKAWARNAVHIRHLDDLTDRIRVLEKTEKKPGTNRGKKNG